MTLDDFQRMLSNAGIDLKLMVHQHEKIARFSASSEWVKFLYRVLRQGPLEPRCVRCRRAESGVQNWWSTTTWVLEAAYLDIFGILRPEVDVQLVEPLTKRVAFLKTAARKLSLDNIKVHRTRWPIESSEAGQVVSRAVVSPETWPGLANSHSSIQSIYRYLARQRPPFEQGNFELLCPGYQRAGGESLRIER